MLSYNHDYWKLEQEIKAPQNWQQFAKEKPWYHCITQKTIAADPLAGLYYEENGSSREMVTGIVGFYMALGYEPEIRCRSRAGYLPVECYGVMPYLGQWGKGWIVSTQKTTSSVNMTYILIPGGAAHGH